MKTLYNRIRKPAQKFFDFVNKKYHCLMWLIPFAVAEIALQSGTLPTWREMAAFVALMGYCGVAATAARYFVRELDHAA